MQSMEFMKIVVMNYMFGVNQTGTKMKNTLKFMWIPFSWQLHIRLNIRFLTGINE